MDTDQKHPCTLNLRPIALKWGQQTLFMRLNSAETCGSADESRALALNLDRKFHDGEGTGACIVVSVGMQCMVWFGASEVKSVIMTKMIGCVSIGMTQPAYLFANNVHIAISL